MGIPLLQPYRAVHGPSIALYRALSKGAGLYVGGTMLTILVILLLSSMWEAFSLRKELNGTDSQCASPREPVFGNITCCRTACLSLRNPFSPSPACML